MKVCLFVFPLVPYLFWLLHWNVGRASKLEAMSNVNCCKIAPIFKIQHWCFASVDFVNKDNSPLGTIPHRIKIKPNYCPPGPLSLHVGQLPKEPQPYKAQVRSIMEYACLCWTTASSTTLSQLDNIQRKALKIIGVNEATARTQLSIPSLTHRREVAAVTVFYKMYTRHCPRDLYKLLPPPLKRLRVTRSSASMPDHALTVPDARTNSLDRSFVHSTVRI